MSDPTERREAVRRNAQSHFTHTERRDELVRQEIEKERAAVDAKTAKLKALRLAKEANEREEAERLAAEREKSGAAAWHISFARSLSSEAGVQSPSCFLPQVGQACRASWASRLVPAAVVALLDALA